MESLINDLDVSGSLSRDQFEELIQPLIGRIKAVLEKVGHGDSWVFPHATCIAHGDGRGQLVCVPIAPAIAGPF